MRKKLVLIFLATLISLAGNMVFPQVIDSLRIIPANPTTADSVKIIAYTVYPYTGCDMVSFSMSTGSNPVMITAYHIMGIMPAFCYSTDTLNMGLFPAGGYSVYYSISDSVSVQDMRGTFFMVSTITSAGGLERRNDISVYHNSSEHTLHAVLHGNERKGKVMFELFDVTGKVVLKKDFSNSMMIDAEDLNGIYFYKISDSHSELKSGKLVCY